MANRRVNGEGTIYRRKDGRYEGAAFLLTVSGRQKRVRVYGKTQLEAREKLASAKSRVELGAPIPDNNPQLGSYLEYWLEQIVRTSRRPATYDLYEGIIRLYLKPGLGAKKLDRLSVREVQAFLNEQLAHGRSIRQVQVMRAVLGTALTQAMREEIIVRNVARLVELPTWERKEIIPWTSEEAVQFLAAIDGAPLEAAFTLLVCYGMRKGEVLGLRWQDVDLENNEVRVRQQVHRAGGKLLIGPVKTRAGKRNLPLLSIVAETLEARRHDQDNQKRLAGDWWLRGDKESDLIFTTASGHPIDPKNFNRSFDGICAQHGIRRISVHHVRHTAATLLKKLNVPVRDVQLILGHSNISTTQQIYQHDDQQSRRDALTKLEKLITRDRGNDAGDSLLDEGDRSLLEDNEPDGCRQSQPSTLLILTQNDFSKSGGVWETRTPDLLHAISTNGSIRERVQGVNTVIAVRRSRWIVGLAAVTLAVKTARGSVVGEIVVWKTVLVKTDQCGRTDGTDNGEKDSPVPHGLESLLFAGRLI